MFNVFLEISKITVLLFFLYFVFDNADFSGFLSLSFKILAAAVVVDLSLEFGKHFSDFYEEKWKNYLLVLYAAGIVALITWAGYGTHVEDADPMFGGGQEVTDFIPTSRERDTHGATVFLVLAAPALYGVYKGREENNS